MRMHKIQIYSSKMINLDACHVLRHSIQAVLLVPPNAMCAPVIDGVLYHGQGDTILFRPLLASEIGGQTS